jgi:hypothetical protein
MKTKTRTRPWSRGRRRRKENEASGPGPERSRPVLADLIGERRWQHRSAADRSRTQNAISLPGGGMECRRLRANESAGPILKQCIAQPQLHGLRVLDVADGVPHSPDFACQRFVAARRRSGRPGNEQTRANLRSPFRADLAQVVREVERRARSVGTVDDVMAAAGSLRRR